MLSICDLPEDTLMEVLYHLSCNDLVLRCRLVCTQWKDIIDSSILWKRKCLRQGYISKKCIKDPPDWKMLYYICHFKHNLLKNPSAEDEFDCWEKISDGGDCWRVEDLPGDHGKAFPGDQVKKYFVTSYGMCEKLQIIDLNEVGYRQELMDIAQPEIRIKDWFAARHDCGCRYTMEVQLLDENHQILQEFCSDTITIEQWSDAEWRTMEHTFRNYGPGVRYISFQHGGSDTQNWAGWYGVRVTNSSVTLEPEDLSTDPLPLSSGPSS
ncbi:F-box only protein 44 [Bombina bombina]|uniref:F-box only protein 44 n=1 Tax=Bombina bombina TaxID=8345 RepID=UPI00235AF9EC|nr:F-box only protein 44 [Bombina bombina]XP_053547430.1 F-box only protein 44 [Bombina bombina]